MDIQSFKWDRKCELEESFKGCVRKGTSFTVNSKTVSVSNIDKQIYDLELLINNSKNLDCTVTFNNVNFTRLEADKLYRNMISWVKCQQDNLNTLQSSLVSKTSFSDINTVVWTEGVITLDSSAFMIEDTLEHHDNMYWKRSEPIGGSSTTYTFSGSDNYTINHNLNYYPTITVLVGGGEVITQVDHLSKNSVKVSFNNTTGCDIVVS